MSELHLPPVDKWTDQARDGSFYLVDPIDGLFDPDRPPSYIQEDAHISEGLQYLADNGKRIRVSLSLGLQGNESDLGPSGWIEDRATVHDAFGHSIEPAFCEANGYYKRIMTLLGGTGTKAYSHVPSEATAGNPADIAITGMQESVQQALQQVDNGYDTGGVAADYARVFSKYVMAAVIITRSAEDWYAAGTIGLAAKKYYDDVLTRRKWSTLVVMDPMGADTERKLNLLGVQVNEEPYRRFEETWDEHERSRQLPAVMAAGYFTAGV